MVYLYGMLPLKPAKAKYTTPVFIVMFPSLDHGESEEVVLVWVFVSLVRLWFRAGQETAGNLVHSFSDLLCGSC